MFGGIGYLVFERRARRDERRRKQHSKFADVLQLARTESEAHQVVKRYLERVVPRSTATVLNRNNSANRLEATTEVGTLCCSRLSSVRNPRPASPSGEDARISATTRGLS